MIDPPYIYDDYRSTHKRAPHEPPVELAPGALDTPGPVVPAGFIRNGDNDLTIRGESAPLGERMFLAGRIVGADGKPVRNSLVEIWQANASGRYHHPGDQHDAPLDPNFEGVGRTLTDGDGNYAFITVKPGSYPWFNHPFAWRPQHIHFSLLGNAPVQRLITQMYFPGDPLLDIDPIYNSVPDPEARKRMICRLDLRTGKENYALGYRFDIVLEGAKSTPMGL